MLNSEEPQWSALRSATPDVPELVQYSDVALVPRVGIQHLQGSVAARGDHEAMLTQGPADRLDPSRQRASRR